MAGNTSPLATLRETFLDAVQVSLDFFKVLIPIIIGMKILAELDWIRYLALPLEPVMRLTGLPPDLGIAWATGIMVNFYSALIVFVGLLPGLPPLTTEQTTTLAVMIAAAGYLNYSSKKEVAGAEVYEAGMMDISDSDILAENQAKNGVDDGKLKEIASLDGDGEELLPDGNEVAAMPESAESAGAEVSGQETAAAGIENPGEAVLTGGTGISEYIAGVQLGREQIRAKNKETLMQIINSDQISEEEKQTAIQNLIGMTEISEKENAAETLLKAKGFVDPVVSITDGKADVVVNAASLSDQERAQIEDIVKRKTEIGADGIVITLLDVDE